MRTLILIPAYNEERNLPIVLEDIRTHMGAGADVLVINDGSTDRTSETARAGGATVIDLPMNLGIGGGMQAGFIYASRMGYDAAVQFDGDAQHRADQLPLILGPLERGEADVIVGSRFIGKALGTYKPPLSRLLGIKIFGWVLSALTGWPLTDTTSGFRAYGRRAVELFARYYPDDYPEVEALVLLKKAGLTAREVPVLMRERPWGASSITPVRSVYYMVKVLLAVLVGALRETKA